MSLKQAVVALLRQSFYTAVGAAEQQHQAEHAWRPSKARPGFTRYTVIASSALCGAFLIGVLSGVVLAQQQPIPPDKSKGFKTDMLGTLDLAEEIEGMVGRQLRMRRITVEPGGQFTFHDHRDRPGLFYVQDGTITDYPEGGGAREHTAGQAVPVGFRTRHWEENRGTSSVIVIAVDIVKK
jgi:quercetin dioxygenase-like cupin family protein